MCSTLCMFLNMFTLTLAMPIEKYYYLGGVEISGEKVSYESVSTELGSKSTNTTRNPGDSPDFKFKCGSGRKDHCQLNRTGYIKLQMNSSYEEERSSCPFCWNVSVDQLRIPKVIYEVKCLCNDTKCSNGDHFKCTEIKKRVFLNWYNSNQTQTKNVTVGCVCAGSKILPGHYLKPVI